MQSFSSADIKALVCWINLNTHTRTRQSQHLGLSAGLGDLDTLGDEAPGLAAVPSVSSLQEQ